MTLIEAMDKSDKYPQGDVLIRRKCWREQTHSLEVGSDSFWDLIHGKAVEYRMSPSEIRADDWICCNTMAPDFEDARL